MGATVSIYLDARIKKEDGVYPVKIRVTQDMKRVYLGIDKSQVNSKLEGSYLSKYRYDGPGNYSMSEKLFRDTMKAERGQLKDLRTIFEGIRLDAQTKADSLTPFNFDGFKSLWLNKKDQGKTVFALFDEIISDLNRDKRVGTAASYQIAKNSLKKFTGVDDVPFEFFTKVKLEEYHKWMINGGKSDTTVGMNLRALRVAFNTALSKKITEHYPFNRGIKKEDGKYQIPKGGGRKIALDKSELAQIFSYSVPDKHPYAFYFDCWKLMYKLGGLNPVDLCNLTEKNIQGKFIHFVRQKTVRTNRETKVIKVPFPDDVAAIVNKWRPEDKTSFLLPVLTKEMNAKTKKAKVAQFVKMINRAMKAISKEIGITKNVTSYVARHSLATRLLQSGASLKLISGQLGHTSVATTELYLKDFSEDQINEAYLKMNE